MVDIDGSQKGKNSFGYDKFYFETSNNAVITPNRLDGTNGVNLCDTNTKILADISGCASAWIINYDNMDYLKCKDKLSETVITCK